MKYAIGVFYKKLLGKLEFCGRQSCDIRASHSDCTVLTVTVSLGRDPHELATGVSCSVRCVGLPQFRHSAQGLGGHSV